jgi:curved DNA-binding protein CbpA
MNLELNHGLFKYGVKDYYAVLGVPVDANPKDIRLRYLKIAYLLHPDTCTASTPEAKQRASQILAKLLNPAYENLTKDKLRRECQLILSETGRRLASESSELDLVTETAQKLYGETNNSDKLYHELIEKLAENQYQDLENLTKKIALMSELNLVYILAPKEVKRQYATSGSTSAPSKSSSPEPIISVGVPDNPLEASNIHISRVEKLLRSAKQHEQRGDFEQGIFDLRDAVKIEPNNGQVHALLSYLYLQQGNTPYAKVHYKKALELNPQDFLVKKLHQELKQYDRKSSEKRESKNKKETPKIFGIRLW